MLNRSIINWLEINVKEPEEYGYFFPAALVALFPKLSLMKGIYLTPDGKRNCHYWAEEKNTIYSAGKVYGDRYIQIKPVGCDLIQIISDPNFSLLPLEDQYRIVMKWNTECENSYKVIGTNVYAKKKLEAAKTISPVFLGNSPINYLGIYIEHSDFPNVTWRQVGNVFTFETLRNIDLKEKLTINHRTFPKGFTEMKLSSKLTKIAKELEKAAGIFPRKVTFHIEGIEKGEGFPTRVRINLTEKDSGIKYFWDIMRGQKWFFENNNIFNVDARKTREGYLPILRDPEAGGTYQVAQLYQGEAEDRDKNTHNSPIVATTQIIKA